MPALKELKLKLTGLEDEILGAGIAMRQNGTSNRVLGSKSCLKTRKVSRIIMTGMSRDLEALG